MKIGKSQRQIAGDNVKLVTAWIEERNQRLDWHEYAYNNRINRSVVAQELDFVKSVCTQNPAVRLLLEAADAIWFKNEVEDKAAHEAARERAQAQSSRMSSDNSDLIKRVAELEAENRQIRRELNAFKKQQAMVECGLPGFKI